MQFLSDIYVKCSECEGKVYLKSTIQVTGKSIHEILELTVDSAIIFLDQQRTKR